MPLCTSRSCGCAITGPGVAGGSGEPGSPWVIETGGVTICTSVTRPLPPYQGQQIFETDTDRSYVYEGSTWWIVRDPAPHVQVTSTWPGNTDLASATMTLMLDLPTVTVPPWATAATVTWMVSGWYFTGAGAANAGIYLGIDGTAPLGIARILTGNAGASIRTSGAAQGSVDGLTPGATITPQIWATGSNSLTLRFDVACRADIRFDWKE